CSIASYTRSFAFSIVARLAGEFKSAKSGDKNFFISAGSVTPRCAKSLIIIGDICIPSFIDCGIVGSYKKFHFILLCNIHSPLTHSLYKRSLQVAMYGYMSQIAFLYVYSN